MFYISLQYLLLVLLYPFSRWILTRIKSREHLLILHITLGLSSCAYFFKQRFNLLLLSSILGFFILDYNPHIVFVVSLTMHVFILFLQLIQPKCIKVTSISKLILFKIIATSYNIESGRKNKAKVSKKSEQVESDDLDKKPLFLEWIAYCFTPFGCASNVFYEFRFFNYLLKPSQNYERASEESHTKALKCFKRSIIYMIIYGFVKKYLHLKFFQSQFFLSLNFIIQTIFVWFIIILFFLKRFIQFKAIDAGLYEMGVYDHGFYTPTDYEILLTQSTIKSWSFAFNPTFYAFHSKYFSKHLSDPRFGLNDKIKKIIAFLNKPLIKGFHGAFYLGALQKKILFFVEKHFHIVVDKSKNAEILLLIFTQIIMISNRATISFMSTRAFFLMSYNMHFFVEIASILIIICSNCITNNKTSSRTKYKQKK